MDREKATMTELCEHFGISMNTARTDVAYLVNKGVVRKVYGGVQKKQIFAEEKINAVEDFYVRSQTNVAQKRLIGQRAAALLEDQDVVFIDSGSSTMFILNYVPEDVHVTVLTGSLSAVYYAAKNENISVYLLPGKFNRKTNSVSDISTAQYLSQFNFNKAFIAATAVSNEGNLTVYSSTESNVKKMAIANSSQKILLADSSKFGKRSMITFSTIDEMDIVITDDMVGNEFRGLCGNKGLICSMGTAG